MSIFDFFRRKSPRKSPVTVSDAPLRQKPTTSEVQQGLDIRRHFCLLGWVDIRWALSNR